MTAVYCSRCSRVHEVRRSHATPYRDSNWRIAGETLYGVALALLVLAIVFVALPVWLS